MSYAQRIELAENLIETRRRWSRSSVRASRLSPRTTTRRPSTATPLERRSCRSPGEQIVKTHHVAWYLREQQVLKVNEAPALDARYVDYEIAPTRTTDHAAFDDDGGSGAPVSSSTCCSPAATAARRSWAS